MNMRKVLVIGSINGDRVTEVPHFPKVGETIMSENSIFLCGGKGANQAIAVSRLGAQVSLIGAVGDDELADKLLSNLKQENVNVDAVMTVKNTCSGLANVMTCKGENIIVVVEGANAYLSEEHVLANEALFKDADIILAQLEIPLNVVELVADLALKYEKPFILNPAPAKRLPSGLIEKVTLLTPNEHEFVYSLDLNDSDIFGLFDDVTENVVLTRGAEGAYFYNIDSKKVELQPAFEVDAVDSTGAGDAFSGAMAVYFHMGLSQAVRYACSVAALTVCEQGPQTGMPTEEELMSFLKNREAGIGFKL